MHGRVEPLHWPHEVAFQLTASFAGEASEYADFGLERVLILQVRRAALSMTLSSVQLLRLSSRNCRLLSLSSADVLQFGSIIAF